MPPTADRPCRHPIVEYWRAVPGFENAYDVSNHGRVRRTARDDEGGNATYRGRVLEASPAAKGYTQVNLHYRSKQKTARIHTLVAAAFLGEKPDDMILAHLDGDKAHNCTLNLGYITQREANVRAAARRAAEVQG